MTPALTKKEAKDKCIKMWEHIRDNITDKEWRATVIDEYYKELAIKELRLGYARHSCYLCNEFNTPYHDSTDYCVGCPLNDTGGTGDVTRPCIKDGPYRSYVRNIRSHHYARASAAANRLVEKVRAWEVGE